MAASLSRYLVEQQRARNHIPPELRLLLEVVARACKGISHAVNKGAWHTAKMCKAKCRKNSTSSPTKS